MTLDREEYLEYINIHLDLLYFVGQKQKIISRETDFKKFTAIDFKTKFKCREKLNENTRLLDDYIKTRSAILTIDQIEIIEGFKKKIESDFVIFRCFARHAIFIDTTDNKIYEVRALADRFDKFFSEFPVLCRTTIIPFKGKVIYDGFITSRGIYYGKNMTADMYGSYKQAKIDKTIITTIK